MTKGQAVFRYEEYLYSKNQLPGKIYDIVTVLLYKYKYISGINEKIKLGKNNEK